MIRKTLTVPTVKSLLTRAGIDHSQLTITHIDTTSTHSAGTHLGQYVESSNVRISGDPSTRRQARAALSDHGLCVAPLPQYDDWSRD